MTALRILRDVWFFLGGDSCDSCVDSTLSYPPPPRSFPSREVEFIQKEDAERRRLEEAEKAHLAEIQGLQVRVKQINNSIHLCCLVVLSVSANFSISTFKKRRNTCSERNE